MDHQASVSKRQALLQANGSTGFVGNLADFGSDVATLVELQAKLAAIDIKEAAGKAAVPATLLLGAVVLALAAFPLLLFGIAELIVQYAGMTLGWSLLVTAAGAVVVACGLAPLAWLALRRSFQSLRRSGEELGRNLAWIKTVLAYSGRSAPRKTP
jgi:hypothetical protein